MRRTLPLLAVGVTLCIAGAARAESPGYETGVRYESGVDGGVAATDAYCVSAFPSPNLTQYPPPANAPAILFGGVGLTAVSLVASDGTILPTTLTLTPGEGGAFGNVWVLGLGGELTPGAVYTVHWNDACANDRTESFTARARAALPTTAGTILVGPSSGPPPYAECGASGPSYFTSAMVRLAHDPALEAFIDVARVDAFADGVLLQPSQYGNYRFQPRTLGVVETRCPAAPTIHKVWVRVKLANGPTLTTPVIDVEQRCWDSCESYPFYDSGPDVRSSEAGSTLLDGAVSDTSDDSVDSTSSAPDATSSPTDARAIPPWHDAGVDPEADDELPPETTIRATCSHASGSDRTAAATGAWLSVALLGIALRARSRASRGPH